MRDPQQIAIEASGHILLTACPGSGKTYVLTQKVARTLAGLAGTKRHVVAITYTNRAADEIKRRIDAMAIDTTRLWCGTIHSFCLDWILRPYAGFDVYLRHGYRVIDEWEREALLEQLKERHGVSRFTDINTRFDRNGDIAASPLDVFQVAQDYHACLVENKWIDFDLIIYKAYRLLTERPRICQNLANIFRLICVDEYQDTQDLQYAILGLIASASETTDVMFLGDPNQAIFDSLGGVAKTREAIFQELGGRPVKHLELTGCYRSQQPIIDCYRRFQVFGQPVVAMHNDQANRCEIVYDRTTSKADLARVVARLIQSNIDAGFAAEDICVVAPRWAMLTEISRQLSALLPQVGFDAAGLSPLKASRENFWYRLARLVLTEPTPRMYGVRMGWAQELVCELQVNAGIQMEMAGLSPRKILRVVNSLTSVEEAPLNYLRDLFGQFASLLDIDLTQGTLLAAQWDAFFEGSERRLAKDGVVNDVASLRRLFRERRGVVVNTIHGIKGEEYSVVIAFGLLQGYCPAWGDIINRADDHTTAQAKKLLYVVASRAKYRLYMFSETGYLTQSRRPYQPTDVLRLAFPDQFGFGMSIR